MPLNVGIVSAGAMGTAIAQIISPNCDNIYLYARRKEVCDYINNTGYNFHYYPNTKLHENISAVNELEDLKSVDVIFLCIPSSLMRDITSKLNKIVSKECIFVNTSKGLEKDTNKRMSEIIEEETNRPPIVLSGPNIASEMAKSNFSATTIAGTNNDDLEIIEKLLSTDRFKVNSNNDVIGTEWCGTVKNVLAISQGLCEGMEINANARLAVFTMSFNETKDLIEILGGKRDTVDDYCGFGDMVTASILNVSRNHTLGILYGQRIVIDEKASGVLFEGKNTTEILKGICKELNFNSLTVNFVYDVLINGKTPLEAFDELWKQM